jgi:pilus assembly protein Flp/PilA
MRAIFRAFLGDRSGATAVEYGIIVAVLSLAIVAAIGSVHDDMSSMFIRIADKFHNGIN